LPGPQSLSDGLKIHRAESILKLIHNRAHMGKANHGRRLKKPKLKGDKGYPYKLRKTHFILKTSLD